MSIMTEYIPDPLAALSDDPNNHNWRSKYAEAQATLEQDVIDLKGEEGAGHMAVFLRRSKHLLSKQPRPGAPSEVYEEREVRAIHWTVNFWVGE
jgi:hypothetical protein